MLSINWRDCISVFDMSPHIIEPNVECTPVTGIEPASQVNLNSPPVTRVLGLCADLCGSQFTVGLLIQIPSAIRRVPHNTQ